ncbi:hypothetical protein R5R35_014775 [Gryllus longicercus]|uniref:Charged multivesicular body protein 4b n=1 Tax=Gryllus longicercus TaxID=2509291 RepID=A0AAN9W2K8_9ORTH
MNLFRTSNKDKTGSVSVPDAIQKLRDIELLLQKKQDFLETKIKKEENLARRHAKTNKTLALQALRRKKRYETYLQQVDGTLTTVEMQRETLEGAHTDKLVVESMKVASQALKTANKKLNVDEVHNVMDDLAEERDKALEVSEAISKPVGFGFDDIDEDDLLKELEEMEQEEVDQQLLNVELPSTSQDVPASTSKRKERDRPRDDDEAELAAMGQWAS